MLSKFINYNFEGIMKCLDLFRVNMCIRQQRLLEPMAVMRSIMCPYLTQKTPKTCLAGKDISTMRDQPLMDPNGSHIWQ